MQFSTQSEQTQCIKDSMNTPISSSASAAQPGPNNEEPSEIDRLHDFSHEEDFVEIDSVYDSSEDEDIGEFEAVESAGRDDSWLEVSDSYSMDEYMVSGVADLRAYARENGLAHPGDDERMSSPPPSPLARGYLRSTQDIDVYLHPMEAAYESSDVEELLSFESSTFEEHTPLINANVYAERDSSTRRMWSLGKTALAKLGRR